jgi:hypothetical protein
VQLSAPGRGAVCAPCNNARQPPLTAFLRFVPIARHLDGESQVESVNPTIRQQCRQ